MKHGEPANSVIQRLAVMAGLALGLAASMAAADTVVWTGAASTNWQASGNWTNSSGGAAIPAAGDDVIINGGPRHPTLSVASGATNIASLSIGANNASTLTVANADADARKLIVDGNVSVGAAGGLTHADNATSEVHRLNMQVGGNLTVAGGGRVTGYRKGFDAGYGPGRPLTTAGGGYGGGAGHGGEGGDGYNTNDTGGTVYGSISEPVALGSGGSTFKGGGAVILRVAGQTTIDGWVDADASNIVAVSAGGGSGGSVFLTTGTLGGTGLVSAVGTGASHLRSGQGGGGRIAIVLTNGTSIGGVTVVAWGGSANPTKAGGAGTILIRKSNSTFGDLIVRNRGNDVMFPSGARTLLTNGLFRFDSIITTNVGILEIGGGAVLDLTNGAPIIGDAPASATGAFSRIVVSEGSILFPAAFILTNRAVLSQKGTNAIVFDTSLTVAAGSVLTHEKFQRYDVNFNFTATETNRLNLAVTGDFTLDAGGFVTAEAIGYLSSYGPGAGNGHTGYGSGAGHGGEGAQGNIGSGVSTGGMTYGSVQMPETLGSGGASTALGLTYLSGGGALRLGVGGACTLNGRVTADCMATNGFGDPQRLTGAAGGSVWITAGTLDGAGSITARGGGGFHNFSGQGGGGRISLVATNGNSIGSLAVSAIGGTNNPLRAGAAGTIFVQTLSPAASHLLIDNANRVGSAALAATHLSSNVVCGAVGNVIIRNGGFLRLGTNQMLEVRGEWTNSAFFFAETNSTVVLAGTGAAFVVIGPAGVFRADTNSFYNLSAETAGKVLTFPASAAVTSGVRGALTLRDVSLASASPGTAWHLKLDGAATQDVRRVSVRDSHAIGGQTVTARNSIDYGNNENWLFLRGNGALLLVR
jgi:hypothetical protein